MAYGGAYKGGAPITETANNPGSKVQSASVLKAQQQQAQNMAVVTGQPTFWGRIQSVGIGKVNLLNATKVARTVGRGATAALGESVETAARVLPGGQNDIKAENQAVKSSAGTTAHIQQLRASGKISSQEAVKLFKSNAAGDNQTSEQAHANVEAGSEENQSKQGVQMLEQVPRAVVDVAQTAAKQVKYLAGATSTPQQRNAIITNQSHAASNPEYLKAINDPSVKGKQGTVAGIVQAQDMAAKGAKAADITKFLKQDTAKAATQQGKLVNDAVTIATLDVSGATLLRLFEKVTGKSTSEALAKNVATNKLVKAGEKANAVDTNVGKAAIGAKQAAEAKTADLGKKAVTGRQVTPEPSETKLLGTGTGKVTGKGFTAAPTADVAKIKISARLNTINKKLDDFAKGKISMSAEDVKSLKAEKDSIYKQSRTTNSVSKTNEAATAKLAATKTKSDAQTKTLDNYNKLDDRTKSKTEMVPIEEAAKYMEHDRAKTPLMSSEQYQKLKDDISENGIQEPLTLQYGARDRIAAIGEGNHRLAIAKELGIKEVPMTVSGTQLSKADQLADKKGFAEVPGREPDETGYVPSNQKPSDVGIKTSEPKVTEPSKKETAPQTLTPKKSPRRVSGSALRTEQESVTAGLTKEFEDKATYKSGSYKDEAAKAVQLTHDNPERAMDIAMGRKPGNSILHTSAVYHAVKNKAIAEGDTETLRQLVTSSRHTGVSQAAQKLGSEGYNAVSDDPVERMRQVADARVAAVEKITKSSVPKAINDTAKEIASHEKAPSKFEWQSFVESIKC